MAAAVEARARRRVARASLLDFSLAAAFEGSDGGEPGGGGGWSSMVFVDDGTTTPGIVGGRPPGLGAAAAGRALSPLRRLPAPANPPTISPEVPPQTWANGASPRFRFLRLVVVVRVRLDAVDVVHPRRFCARERLARSLVPFASVRHLSLVNAYVFGEPRFVLRGRFSLTGLPILRFRVHATG